MTKPTLGDPELLARFAAYYRKNPAWGTLHCVLDDGNTRDCDVLHAQTWAWEDNDQEGLALAEVLLTMSQTQRKRLPNVIHRKVYPS